MSTEQNMHNPCHPGEILLDSWLKPLGISVTSAADRMGISRKHLSRIVNQSAGITPDVAKRVQALTGASAIMWLNMQAGYDLWVLRDSDYSDITRVA